MTLPPIRYADLVAMGCDPATSWTFDDGVVSATPAPPRLVLELVNAAMSSEPPDPDQNIATYVRHVRTLLLSLTDWTQLGDAPLTADQRAVWATYRQALRDMPAAGAVQWPSIPG